MNTKTILAIGMTSVMMLSQNACQQSSRENPLLAESSLPFGAPDFSKIQTSDYLPAFEAAIQQTRDNRLSSIVKTQQRSRIPFCPSKTAIVS